MKTRIFIVLFLLTTNVLFSADFYWIGGPGNWSNTARWSHTSGGTPAGIFPTAADNVFFDANSGLDSATAIAVVDINVTVADFNFNPNSGQLNATGRIINCLNFYSNGATSSLNFTNAIINVTNNWIITNGAGLTITSTGSVINATNSTLFIFQGGDKTYNNFTSQSAQLNISNSNTFNTVQLATSSTLTLENGSQQIFQNLTVSGSCLSKTTINTVDPEDIPARLRKAGTLAYTASNLDINNVNAVTAGGFTYTLSSSQVVGSSGWLFGNGTRFYWIGNGGNWTDVNHWSFSSGGSPAGCIPFYGDSVYFDVNSFSASNQEVFVNQEAFFSYMDWSTATNNPVFKLDTTVYSNGTIVLNPGLLVTRTNLEHRIEITKGAQLNTNGATVDCNLSIYIDIATDNVTLISDLIMSDSSGIYLLKGNLSLNNYDVTSGSILVYEVGAAKGLNFTSSSVSLSSGMDASNLTDFTFNAGTSNLYIGDTNRTNFLLTDDLTFNDVVLEFIDNGDTQKIEGNNTYNNLSILKGSRVEIEANSTQTINTGLSIVGTCKDSIYLTSSTTIPAIFNKTTTANVTAQCTHFNNIQKTGATQTVYFSTQSGTNLGWIFNTSPAVNASFTVSGGHCLGDTTLFTNNSTVISGNPNDMTSVWFFGDGSTGYYDYPSIGDSVWISYEADTNKHVFLSGGDFNVVLQTTHNTNLCVSTDTIAVHISNPSVQVTISDFDRIICQGDQVTFEVTSDSPIAEFQFFHNGTPVTGQSANDTIYVTSTLNHEDTVSVLSFENGCVSDTMPQIGFTVNSLPDFSWTVSDADAIICDGDNVSFSGTASDNTYTYQYLLNSNPVFIGANYSTTTLADNDIVYLVGRTINNCRDTLSMTFDVRPLPSTTLASSATGNVICAGESVIFTAGGASLYEFFVNNVSQGSPSATNTWSTSTLTNGATVSVKGYSVDNCSKNATQTFTYTVNNLPNVGLSTTSSTSICSGTPVNFTASGASQYEFFLNGASVQGPSPVNTYSNGSLSDQDVVLVQGSFSGCSNVSSSFMFNVATAPTTTLTSTAIANTSCFQQPITFTATGATNYEYFINGVSQGAPSTTNTLNSSSITNGQIITVNGESNGCVVSQSIPMTILPLPSVNIFSNDPDNAICAGESITFTGTNSVLYELFVNGVSQGTPQSSATFNPTLGTGSNAVSIIGVGPNGCSSTSPTITTTVNPIPTVLLSSTDSDNTICANESVTFTGTGSNLYQFFINGTSQGAMSATNTFTSTDLLNNQVISIVGSSAGCTSNSNTITMTVNPSPTVNLSSTDIDNVFCLGSNVVFTASGATNYEFFVDGVSQGTPSTTTTINSTGFTAGTHTILVNGEQSNCSDFASITVTVNGLPTASINSSDIDNTICSGDNVVYTASGGSLYEFLVNGISQGANSVLNAFTTSSLLNGDVVSVNVTSAQGCNNSSTLPAITVNPTPTISLTSSDLDNEICVGEQVTLTAGGASEYQFFINGVAQGTPSATTTLTSTTFVNGDVVTVSGSELGCPSSSNQLTFTVHTYPIIGLVNNGTTQICANEQVNLSATGALLFQYLINGNPTGIYTPNPNFNGVVNNGDVVTVNGDLNGCTSTSTTSIQYTVLDYPTINAVSSDVDNVICKDELVTFTTTGASEYIYQLNGNTVQTGTNTIFSSNTLETNDVVTVTGFNGDCASTPVQYTFTVNEMNLILTASPSNLICDGTPVTFSAIGADSYQFYLNGASQGAMSSTNSIVLTGLNDLDEITFTGASNTTLCTQNYTDFIIINVMETPIISAITSYEFCEGDSVVLISNSAYGNQWLFNGAIIPGATDTFYVAYQTGTYSLDVTHGGNGDIWSFGTNASGVFGNGDNFNSAQPVQVASSESFTSIASGYDFALAVTQSGNVYSWGKNDFGQLGNGTYTSSNSPIQLASLTTIKAVATAEKSSMAVTQGGTVYVWGENILGQLGTGNTSVINFPYLNPTLTDIDTIVAGKNHFLFLKNDGTVWATGYNASGQLGQGTLTNSLNAVQVTGLSNIVSIGAGENNSFAIDNSGTLYVWGANGSGQLGLGDLTNRLIPAISPLKRVKNAQGGANHSGFATTDNQLYTVGDNTYGQLGLGDYVSRTVPVKVNLGGVDQISTGQYTTLLKRIDGSVFGFGDNSNNQLSSITGNTINIPTHLTELDGVVYVEAGRLNSHVIYGNENTCTSLSNPAVVANAVPSATIIVSNGSELSVNISGVAYQWYLNGLAIPGAVNATYSAITTGIYSVDITLASGCITVSNSQYVGFVGVEDVNASVKITGYPNPVSDLFHINFEGISSGESVSIQLQDYTGRIVKEINTSIQPLLQVSLDGISSGSYQLLIKHSAFDKIIRLIKVD